MSTTPPPPAPARPLPAADAAALTGDILAAVETAIVGKTESLRLVLAGILAKGHVLLEDFPGLGKTLAARSLATALGMDFRRAQFTPDLMPADLTGAFLYLPASGTFEFRPGPVFTGLLLADEINRTPPKTQAALLEAMQEGQVTVEGETFALPSPFHVLATANPVEYEGTYPLPEAQLDRFLMRVGFGYPAADDECLVLTRRMDRGREQVDIREVTDPAGLRALQATAERITVDSSLVRYCVALVEATRSHPQVLVGSSPRGSLGLMLAARAVALLAGRDYAVPEDVKAVAHAVLAHRITIKPELWMTQVSGNSVVAELLASIPTPATLDEAPMQPSAAPTGGDRSS